MCCDRPAYALGYCRMHYVRFKRHGDTTHGRIEGRNGYVLTNAGRRAAGLPLRYIGSEP
jgi:hypothetical protein